MIQGPRNDGNESGNQSSNHPSDNFYSRADKRPFSFRCSELLLAKREGITRTNHWFKKPESKSS